MSQKLVRPEGLVNPETFYISASLFKNITDTSPQPFYGSLVDLVGKEHRISESKSDARLYAVGTFFNGSSRTKKGVKLAQIALFDFDDIPESNFWAMKDRLGKLAYLLHSTFSHGLKHGFIRARLILVLSRDVTADEYSIVTKRFAREIFDQFSIKVDVGSFSPEHLFFGASVPRSRSGQAFYFMNQGYSLNVDLAVASSQKSSRQINESLSSYSGDYTSLSAICRNCTPYNNIFFDLKSSVSLGHRERLRAGQLLRALDLPLEEAVEFFSTQKNFDRHITEKQLRSINGYPPLCSKLADDFGLCDGSCANIQSLKRKSPLFFANNLKRRSV